MRHALSSPFHAVLLRNVQLYSLIYTQLIAKCLTTSYFRQNPRPSFLAMCHVQAFLLPTSQSRSKACFISTSCDTVSFVAFSECLWSRTLQKRIAANGFTKEIHIVTLLGYGSKYCERHARMAKHDRFFEKTVVFVSSSNPFTYLSITHFRLNRNLVLSLANDFRHHGTEIHYRPRA